jgi:hypothetical protein
LLAWTLITFFEIARRLLPKRVDHMKLQQLRYLCQIVDSGLNVTEAAKILHTSQSGISRQVRLLEQELGTEILLRAYGPDSKQKRGALRPYVRRHVYR